VREYQTVYGTVDGVDFQQGLPDLDNLDPREKHLIILDDLMDETDQRVADRFRPEPKTKMDYWFSKYNRVLLHYSVVVVVYSPLSVVVVVVVDTDELFHAYFFYVST
jgi:hypothetical protein